MKVIIYKNISMLQNDIWHGHYILYIHNDYVKYNLFSSFAYVCLFMCYLGVYMLVDRSSASCY